MKHIPIIPTDGAKAKIRIIIIKYYGVSGYVVMIASCAFFKCHFLEKDLTILNHDFTPSERFYQPTQSA